MIDRPNQVWWTDIIYIPLRFLHLVAIMDQAPGKVLAWRLLPAYMKATVPDAPMPRR